MEIIWLSTPTIAFISIIVVYFIKNNKYRKTAKRQITQSDAYEIVKQFIVRTVGKVKEKTRTQSEVYEDSMHVKVVLTNSQAFWILNNTLFVAEQFDGIIEKETTRPVDTMAMDKVELDKTATIVQTLTEGGEDDYRSTRN